MKKILLVFGLLLVATGANAADRYVRPSATCPNNGNGTAASCAVSPGAAGAYSGFINANTGISASDTLHLIAGDTYTSSSGLAISKSNAHVQVDGVGSVTISLTGSSDCLSATAGGVVFDGILGNQAFGANQAFGIVCTNLGSGGRCGYTNASGSNIVFRHIECRIATASEPDDNFGGFYLSGGNGFEVSYTYVHPTGATKSAGTCITIWPNGDGTSSYTAGGISHDNRCDNVSNDGIRTGVNGSIYHNEVSRVDGSGHSDSLLAQSGSHIAIYNNWVHGSGDQNIYLDNLYNSTCTDVLIYNNTLDSNPGFGMNIDAEGGVGGSCPGGPGGSSSKWDAVTIANNTFYNTSASAIRTSNRGQPTNLVFLNNIFGAHTDGSYHNIDAQSNTTWASSSAVDYDVYVSGANFPQIFSWTSNYTLAQLQALSPARETHGKVCTPSYVNPAGGDYHLATSDTCAKGAGTNLLGTYPFLATDQTGATRPTSGAWDIGALASAPGSGSGGGVVFGNGAGLAFLPPGTTGQPYSFQFSATGGTPPYNWSQNPTIPGLGLSASTGLLSGTPTTAGTYPSTYTVTDNAGSSASASPSLTVAAITPPPPPPPPSTTFGYTTAGASSDSGDSNWIQGSTYNSGPGGTLQSCSVYVGAIQASPGNKFQLGIYDAANNLVASSSQGTLVANTWNTVPISATVAPNATYRIVYNTNGTSSSVNNLKFDSGGTSGQFAWMQSSFGTWPAKWVTKGSSAMRSSTYCTYGTPAPPSVSVTIAPTSATVQLGGSQQFAATVSNSTDPSVTWSANAPAGLFTAFAPGSFIVTATSVADPTKSASASVTVPLPPLGISCSSDGSSCTTTGIQPGASWTVTVSSQGRSATSTGTAP